MLRSNYCDAGWYIRLLKEVPGVFRQGETLNELDENIRDADDLILKDEPVLD